MKIDPFDNQKRDKEAGGEEFDEQLKDDELR